MGTRLEFQTVLEALLGSGNVYFQPPTNTSIVYPAIVYDRYFATSRFADNIPYSQFKRYRLTVMDQNPDSLIPDKVFALPMTTFVRHFTSGNLNHDIYDVYF